MNLLAPPSAASPNSSPTPPTLIAAQALLDAVRPGAYARSRNELTGATTKLSRYITHGIVTLPQVLTAAAARESLHVQHRLVFELGWRAYFEHVWQHRGNAIFESFHPGPLPDSAYAQAVPDDVLQARTGVPAIDRSVQALHADGYLHNHARLWLASYMVHLRKLHWRACADWFYGHVVDGDLASNHLSWQWVAGTASSKPYLFNADNVARFAPHAWHSPNTVIDAPYQTIDSIARTASTVVAAGPAPSQRAGSATERPRLQTTPAAAVAASAGIVTPGPAAADAVRGRTVWLVHPWALGEPPADLPPDTLLVAAFVAEFHRQHPWSEARWEFVATRMAEITPHCWFTSAEALQQALAGARSVETVANLHIAPHLPSFVRCRPAPRLFPDVEQPCQSFSKWWSHATRGLRRLSDLPGLAGPAVQPASPS